jgi:hypothetical protein
MGCYIDLLPNSDPRWDLPEVAAAACQRFCGLLRVVPLVCCRIDLVIRRAFITADTVDLGITAYVTSCGESSTQAMRTLEAALSAFTDAARCAWSQATLK